MYLLLCKLNTITHVKHLLPRQAFIWNLRSSLWKLLLDSTARENDKRNSESFMSIVGFMWNPVTQQHKSILLDFKT